MLQNGTHFVRQTVKSDPYSMPRNGIDHIALDYHVNAADRNAQRKCRSLRNLGLGAEVKPAVLMSLVLAMPVESAHQNEHLQSTASDRIAGARLVKSRQIGLRQSR